MASTSPALHKLTDSPGGSSYRPQVAGRGRPPLPTPPSQGTSSKPNTWASSPASWSRRANPTTSTSSPSSPEVALYPANTYPSSNLGTAPSKINALAAKFESQSKSSSPTSPSTTSQSAASRPPTSVRSQLGGAGGPSWKNLPPPPAPPTDAPPSDPASNGVAPSPADGSNDAAREVSCSLCDHVFVFPTHKECPMCGEAYSNGSAAPTSSSSPNGHVEEEGPRQVECSLCDHPYVYPTQRECPMCGEPFGSVEEPPAPTPGPSGTPAPGSITAMLMQLQLQAQQQQSTSAAELPENQSLQQMRLDEESNRPKSIEEESKRMVMCGHCNHTYEYPTFNFCDNCGHPSSTSSLRLSQIKRQTWAQGRQSMQIGAADMQQVMNAMAGAAGSGPAAGGGPDIINFCPDCGTATDGGDQKFCGMCGKSFFGEEPALPESDSDPSSPTTSEREKLKKKNKSWGKKTSYRTYFKEMGSSPITARVKKFSKRGDKSARGIEVRGDWHHTISAALPSTPDAIAAYKQMMIAKYEAQQKENVFIRSSRRGSRDFRTVDAATLSTLRQGVSEDGSLSPRQQYVQAPLSPRGGTSYRGVPAAPSSPALMSFPSAAGLPQTPSTELDERIGCVLAELNLSKYGVAFAQEEITYEAFLLLEADDLMQMGIPIGPRKLILSKILELKQS